MAKIPKLPDTGINVGIVTSGDDRPELWAPQPGPQTMMMLSDEFEIFLGGAKGGGKAAQLSSLVSTPFGFKPMGKIKIGDQVSNPLGSVANVIAVHPQGEQDLFRVCFSDGAETVVTDEHLWLARLTARKMKADRRYYGDDRQIDAKIYTTKWLKQFIERQAELHPERDENGNGPCGVLIPLTEPVEFTRPDWAKWGKTYTFDPYVLGLLLGDGCLRQNQISFSSADEQIVSALRLGTGLEVVRGSANGNPYNWRVRSPQGLMQQLGRLGVYDKLAHEKFVPDVYRMAPLSIRREVLQGLMDTDGYVDDRGHCSFTSVSETLAKNVQWMARSLGFKATITRGEAGYRDESGNYIQCRDAFDVYLQGKGTRELFKLSRKRDRCKDTFNGVEGSNGSSISCRRITSIESAGKGEAQCITVDHPNGLYLTDDFIVTHNSFGIIGFLLKGNPDVPLEKATPLDLSYINCPDYRALVVRKNLEDLNSWISEAYNIYSKLGANYTQKPNEFTFPSGAKIIMGHLDDDRAAEKYFGNVVHRAAVDELTFIDSVENYMKLYSCVRSNVKGIKPQMLLTGNPGGPGTTWVMERFVEPIDELGEVIPPLTTIREREWNPFTKRVEEMTRIFIPAALKDNPKLVEKDPLYYNRLAGLPDAQRKAYLEGDWHALGGVFYTEFRSKHRENEPPEACHVIVTGSRPLLPWLPRLGGCDWGFGHHAVVYGAVKDLNGQTIVHRELFVKEMGTVELGDAIARLFLPDLEGLYKAGASPLIPIYLSPDAFEKKDAKTQAESIAEGIARVLGPKAVHLPDLFEPASHMTSEFIGTDMFSQVRIQEKSGLSICVAQNARCAGWAYVREMLRWREIAPIAAEQFDYEVYYSLVHSSLDKAQIYYESFQRRKKEILPKLLIEDHCKALISSIPALVHDPKNIEDVLKTNALCDDVADAARYMLYSQGVSDNKEPKYSFIARQVQQAREREPDMSYNDLCWVNRAAEAKYAEQNQAGAFSVPIDSSRGAKFSKKAN